MEQGKAAALAGYRQKLETAIPWAERLLERLSKDDFEITHIRARDDSKKLDWFVRARPPRWLQEGYGLAPEILLVIVRGELQAKTLQAAAEEVIQSGLRLDGNLMIVCDEKPDLTSRLTRIGGHGQRVAWTPNDNMWEPLGDVLRRQLPIYDAFEERDPVRGAQLIGRDIEIAELRSRVARGDAVALFGLRKMGKTSIMRAITDWFDPASGMKHDTTSLTDRSRVAVVIDATVLLDRTVDELGDALLSALDRRMKAAGESKISHKKRGISGLKHVLESILDQARHVCIAIDEYDLLFEGESSHSAEAIPGINRFFRLIRGLTQMHQGQVSLILAGRDSTFLSAPEIDGVTNALLMWCTPMWIGPLAPNDAKTLLRRIGKRVGLTVGSETSSMAYEWTGGHPMLHRQFGSALRSVAVRPNPHMHIATDPKVTAAIQPFKSREAVLEVARETVALLSKRHPTSLGLLRALAEGGAPPECIAAAGGEQSPAFRMLINFGLIGADGTMSRFLRWYLTEHAAFPATMRAG